MEIQWGFFLGWQKTSMRVWKWYISPRVMAISNYNLIIPSWDGKTTTESFVNQNQSSYAIFSIQNHPKIGGVKLKKNWRPMPIPSHSHRPVELVSTETPNHIPLPTLQLEPPAALHLPVAKEEISLGPWSDFDLQKSNSSGKKKHWYKLDINQRRIRCKFHRNRRKTWI